MSGPGLLLLVAAASIAAAAPLVAQDRRTPERAATDARQPSTTRTPHAAEDAAAHVRRDEPPIPARSVRVRIRYPRSLGYLDTSPFRGDTVNSCGAFVVDALVVEGAQGTFGAERSVAGEIIREPRMRRDGRDYVCDFTIAALPLDRPLTIRGRVAESDPLYRDGRWRGEGRAQPPLGHVRALDPPGGRRVTLTSRRPWATVDLEMRYVRRRQPAVPR